MEWEGREESENVEDRRGFGMRTGVALGGGGLIIVILAMLFGADPRQVMQLLQQGGMAQPNAAQQAPADPEEEREAHFTKVIFHDTEVVWDELFHKMGKRYEKPILVLYRGQVDSACGTADSAVGPFYCPGDARVYIDLSFYDDMQRKLHAPGEFARAYVVAHEVGHHVQSLLGYSQKVDSTRRRLGAKSAESHHMSVRLELQADYFAGVWAHHGQRKFNFLGKGDVESALHAAFEIGDDRLQKQARGYVVPDSFTHGTSKQRMYWFNAGFKSGDVDGAAALFELPYERL
jgi:predicted metalloprotease